jgi:hypothetical protein
MQLEDKLAAIDKWAKINKTDCQLAGSDEQAFYFESVSEVIGIVRSQRALIETLDKLAKMNEAEIARLNTLVFYK